jgi:hypothetical protein
MYPHGCIIDTNARADTKELKMANTKVEYTLGDVADAISDINTDPKNDFGQTVGDELHDIAWTLTRIADALEKIANK